MMEVPTPSVWKTSTCSTLLSRPLISTASAGSTGSACLSPGSRSTTSMRCLQCRVLEPDDWCHRCGAQGLLHDTVVRRLAHVPLGWRPTILALRVRRYRCTGCGHVWRQDTSSAAAPRAKLSCHAVLWALKSVVIDRCSIARVAANLGTSWHTVNDAVLAAGRQLLINDPTRLDGVRVLGVDEHCWRHTRGGPHVRHRDHRPHPGPRRSGPARLLDMVEGRSKAVFKTWLDAQTQTFRDGIEVVAMDGFTGFKTAAAETVPDAVAVMDPFHVVALAGDALDRCRQRIQQQTCGHRGRTGDPLYGIRRALRTGAGLLTGRQRSRLNAVFADERTPRRAGHLDHLSTHRRCLPQPRPHRCEDRADHGHRRRSAAASPPSCPNSPASGEPCTAERSTCSPTSTGPTPATDQLRRSTAA